MHHSVRILKEQDAFLMATYRYSGTGRQNSNLRNELISIANANKSTSTSTLIRIIFFFSQAMVLECNF